MPGNTAVVVTKQVQGEVHNIEARDLDVPKPTHNQVLVNVTARPLHPAELLQIQGLYPSFQPERLPAVPGGEGEALGLQPELFHAQCLQCMRTMAGHELPA